jgi:hypothetical protein
VFSSSLHVVRPVEACIVSGELLISSARTHPHTTGPAQPLRKHDQSFRTSGIRSWYDATSSLGSSVTMAKAMRVSPLYQPPARSDPASMQGSAVLPAKEIRLFTALFVPHCIPSNRAFKRAARLAARTSHVDVEPSHHHPASRNQDRNGLSTRLQRSSGGSAPRHVSVAAPRTALQQTRAMRL